MGKTLQQLLDDPTQGNVNPSLGSVADAESKSVVPSTGFQATLTSIVNLLTAIGNNTDGLEGFTDGLEGFLDGVEGLLTTANTNATSLQGFVDGLEALTTSLNGYVDGLEGQTGGLTETAPASDTASSGLNGRLQRVAQRLTTLIAATGAIGDPVVSTGNSGSLLAMIRTIMETGLSAAAALIKIDQTGTNNQIALGNSPAGNTAKTYTGSFAAVAGATLTRPANTTAYAIGDSISNNATAGSVTALTSNNLSDTNDHPIDLAEILLATTDTGPGTVGAMIRIHLFNSDPTASTGVVGGDNAAYSNKQAGWVGSFSGTMRPFSDGSRGVLIPDEGSLRMLLPVSGARNLYWQLEARTAFTPSANSTTFTPTFKGFQARAA